MIAQIFNDGVFQGVGNDGLVVPYGKLYVTVSSTGLNATTYQDSASTITNTNPVILSSSGKAKVFFLPDTYDITLKDSLDNVVWTLNDYSVSSSVMTTQSHLFTAIEGQTSFNVVYEVGFVDVLVNGVKLRNTDFTATNGTSITLVLGCTVNDEVEIIAYGVYEVSTAPTKGETPYSVPTTSHLLSVPEVYKTVLVETESEPFAWSSTGTADNIITFAGVTGYWVRQFSGYVNEKWANTLQDAVDYCYANNMVLECNRNVATTSSITHWNDIKKTGSGTITANGIVHTIMPTRSTINKLYVSKTGVDTKDGLSSANALLTIQKAIDILQSNTHPIVGRVQIIIGDGVYGEALSIPNGLALNDNYLEFVGSTQSLHQDPSTWTGTILSGTAFTGLNTTGCDVGSYNNIEFEYILFKDWYNNSLTNVQQTQNAVNVNEYANVYFYGCAGLGNGYTNISVNPMGRAVILGGVYDGGRYVINNTGGRLSFSATSSANATYLNNGLEYGIYGKHNSSTVCQYTEFENNGQIAAAASYGSALFAYKSGTSIDTLGCVFKKNNIVYNARGGYISSNPATPDTLGTGTDSNDRVWLNKGFGQDDIINYKAISGRDLTVTFGGGTTTGATAALAYDSNAVVPEGYLINTDQYMEIEIWGRNSSGGTAQCMPSFYDNATSTRYQLLSLLIPDTGYFKVKMIVQTSSSVAVATVFWDANGASIGGTYSGQAVINPIHFDTASLEFQVWGTTTSTNTLSILKSRCLLWG